MSDITEYGKRARAARQVGRDKPACHPLIKERHGLA